LTVQPCLSLPADIKKAPFVVPTSMVIPPWPIAIVLCFSTTRRIVQPALKALISPPHPIPPRLLCAGSNFSPPKRARHR
jgi:hypothetical protein